MLEDLKTKQSKKTRSGTGRDSGRAGAQKQKYVHTTTRTCSNLRSFYTNIDSFVNKREEFLMRIADVSPDIIGLTEMKPKNPRYLLQEAEIGIDGYECWPAISSSGRGVAIYTKTALQAMAVTPLPDCSFKDAIWCEIRLCRGDKLLVGCVYRSPNSTNDNNALLLALLKSATNGRHSHVVIMGDFNYPEIDWIRECSNVGVNHQATKFMEGVRDTFMHQHVEHPTHRRGNHQANTLDLIFSNEQGMVDNVEHNPPIGKSHHVVLQWRINCYCELQIIQKESVQYHRGDYEGFNEYLSQQDWSLMDGKSVTDQWDNFEDIMKRGIDLCTSPHSGHGKRKE